MCRVRCLPILHLQHELDGSPVHAQVLMERERVAREKARLAETKAKMSAKNAPGANRMNPQPVRPPMLVQLRT